MRYLSLFVSVFAAFLLVGCGPMTMGPMPPRLEAQHQQQIDEGWERALNPVDHLDRQALLDALTLTQAFQLGVDRLEFRSEKAFSGGMVVMEIHFNRRKPADDRFEVTVFDEAGKELRRLAYDRSEVELTFSELCLQREGQPPLAPAEQAKKQQEKQQRIDAASKLWNDAVVGENGKK